MKISRYLFVFVSCLLSLVATAYTAGPRNVLTGKDAFADYTQQHPGVFRKLTLADLPAPYATETVQNDAKMVSRPDDAWPQALPGFKVELYAEGLKNPRLLRTAPNGDIFLAESHANRVMVF